MRRVEWSFFCGGGFPIRQGCPVSKIWSQNSTRASARLQRRSKIGHQKRPVRYHNSFCLESRIAGRREKVRKPAAQILTPAGLKGAGVAGHGSLLLTQQVREKPQPQWQEAYAYRGTGNTFDRKMKIEALYERWVPVPTDEREDIHHVQEFIDAVKQLVKTAIDSTRGRLVMKRREVPPKPRS